MLAQPAQTGMWELAPCPGRNQTFPFYLLSPHLVEFSSFLWNFQYFILSYCIWIILKLTLSNPLSFGKNRSKNHTHEIYQLKNLITDYLRENLIHNKVVLMFQTFLVWLKEMRCWRLLLCDFHSKFTNNFIQLHMVFLTVTRWLSINTMTKGTLVNKVFKDGEHNLKKKLLLKDLFSSVLQMLWKDFLLQLHHCLFCGWRLGAALARQKHKPSSYVFPKIFCKPQTKQNIFRKKIKFYSYI